MHTTLDQYIAAMEQAISVNHPRNWARYQDDPIGCWRYIMRNFGHGLAAYPEKEVLKKIGNLYGQWFIKLDFTSNRPNIDAKQFNTWALDAMREAQAKDA